VRKRLQHLLLGNSAAHDLDAGGETGEETTEEEGEEEEAETMNDIGARLSTELSFHAEEFGPAVSQECRPDVDDEPIAMSEMAHQKTEEILGLLTEAITSRCHFDVRHFVGRLVEVVLAFDAASTQQQTAEMEELFCGGQTQVGKTAFKALTLIAGRILGFSTIIITTSVKGRDDLWFKLRQDYLAGTEASEYFFNYGETREAMSSRLVQEHAMLNYGGVVIADSMHQMSRMAEVVNHAELRFFDKLLKPFRHVILVDEADELIRTENGDLRKERAYQQLLGSEPLYKLADIKQYLVKPMARVQISATLLPVFLRIAQRDVRDQLVEGAEMQEVPSFKAKNIFITVADPTKYNSVQDLKPPSEWAAVANHLDKVECWWLYCLLLVVDARQSPTTCAGH